MPGWQAWYLMMMPVIEAYSSFIHKAIFGGKLAFAPLMCISLYCAFGIFCSWLLMVGDYIFPARRASSSKAKHS